MITSARWKASVAAFVLLEVPEGKSFIGRASLYGHVRPQRYATVTEFWEIPLYDREGYFDDNPIDRYSINSYMLKRGKLHTADGKLVIYVQNDEPKGREPAQKLATGTEGRIPVWRLYGPGTSLIDGSYNMPGVVRTE